MELVEGIRRLVDHNSNQPQLCDKEQETSQEALSLPYEVGPYLITEGICKGSFGSVYICEHKETEEEYAAKFFENCFIQDERNMGMVLSEVSILKEMSSRHTISFVDLIFGRDGVFIIMELVDGYELTHFFSDGVGMVESFARIVFEQLLVAMQHMHSLGILHRDIKPENVMIDKRGNLKLVDYGFAERALKNRDGLMVARTNGTWPYLAPEVAQCGIEDGEDGVEFAGDKIDIWAAGILLFYVASGQVPFEHWNDSRVFFDIVENNIMWDIDVSPELEDLLEKILQTDPDERLSIEEILRHPWMDKSAGNEKTTFTSRSGRIRVSFNGLALERSASCSKLLTLR